MSKPSIEEVKDLEYQHKMLFAALSLANNTWVNLYKRYSKQFKNDPNYKNSFEYKRIIQLGKQIQKSFVTWFITQFELEKTAGIPKTKIRAQDFFRANKSDLILKQANEYVKSWKGESRSRDISGMGIIPLLIWGVILIVGAVTSAYIISRVTVTTKDRTDLLKETKQTCIDLNLTPEQCANVITTTQHEETQNPKGASDVIESATSGIMKYVLIGALLYFGLPLLKTQKSNN